MSYAYGGIPYIGRYGSLSLPPPVVNFEGNIIVHINGKLSTDGFIKWLKNEGKLDVSKVKDLHCDYTVGPVVSSVGKEIFFNKLFFYVK